MALLVIDQKAPRHWSLNIILGFQGESERVTYTLRDNLPFGREKKASYVSMSERINCLFACYLQCSLPSCLISADSIAHSRLVIPG